MRLRTKQNKHLIFRLEEWGDETARQLHALGYPSQTLEAALMEYGGEIPRSENKPTSIVPEYKTNPRVREIEMIVQTLKPRLNKAIRAKYVMRLKPLEAMFFCFCVRSTYFDRVRRAEQEVNRQIKQRDN